MWKYAIVMACLAPTALQAAKSTDPKEGTYYNFGEVGIKKIVVKGTQLLVTFRTPEEQFHWCPGINVKTTEKATVVTFVRSKASKKPAVDKKAKFGKKLIQTVTIDTKKKNTYVYSGPKQYKQIHKVKQPDGQKGKTKQTSQTTSPRSSAMIHNTTGSDDELTISYFFENEK